MEASIPYSFLEVGIARLLHVVVHVPLLPLFLLATSLAAQAPEAPTGEADAPQPDRWKVSTQVSLTDQAGNKSLRLWTGGLTLSHERPDAWDFESALRSRYGSSEGEVVATNHSGTVSVSLDGTSRWSPFLHLNGERDRFKRLALRLSGGLGARFSLYDAEQGPGELNASLALLNSYERILPSATETADRTRNVARWNLRLRGTEQLRPGVTLSHTSTYEPVWSTLADYLLRTETGIRVLLTERLALSVEYHLDRTSRPPDGVDPNDRLFKTGLIIEF